MSKLSLIYSFKATTVTNFIQISSGRFKDCFFLNTVCKSGTSYLTSAFTSVSRKPSSVRLLFSISYVGKPALSTQINQSMNNNMHLDNAASVKHIQAPTITLHSKSNVLRPALKCVLLQSYSPSYQEYVSKNTSDLKLVHICQSYDQKSTVFF